MTAALVGLLLCVAHSDPRDWTADQRLIVSCFRVQADQVATSLRNGANVNAVFGEHNEDSGPFRYVASGEFAIGSSSWSPLLALAASPTMHELGDDLAEKRGLPQGRSADTAKERELKVGKREADTILILYMLLSHGCDIERHDGYRATALYFAVASGKFAVAKKLLEFGANPNVKRRRVIDGPDFLTPMHAAWKSRELTQLLLDHGADASVRNSEGETPADYITRHRESRFDLIKKHNKWIITDRDSPQFGGHPVKGATKRDGP